MRVISGKARGASLLAPTGKNVRPTSDYVKENLFNIIQADVASSYFLDLFSGSGGVGIEALSRGATHAVFVDSSQKSTDLVRRNLEKTRLLGHATIIKGEIPAIFHRLAGQKFDIVFLDPPYDKGLAEKTITAIQKLCILADGGIIIAEIAGNESFSPPNGLEIYKEKNYGTSKLIFMEVRA
ncbi:MAG: 16S rRNA (guanine(966)-N(2))-methyltransferase RsmD [Defluviitaleaceae bacterium]|nr:16S rRNA (guanine(966)-N(2))-methyltransferase RsmD [Defluviitaleaceae bacterium]